MDANSIVLILYYAEEYTIYICTGPEGGQDILTEDYLMIFLHLSQLHLLFHVRIHDIKHANHPIDNSEGGSDNGTDEVRHNCCSAKSSLGFDGMLLCFAAI